SLSIGHCLRRSACRLSIGHLKLLRRSACGLSRYGSARGSNCSFANGILLQLAAWRLIFVGFPSRSARQEIHQSPSVGCVAYLPVRSRYRTDRARLRLCLIGGGGFLPPNPPFSCCGSLIL